ncbi:unnamed protein product [Ostreobium quekettii]|uniref:Pre-mRNA-processing factor 39 n=1 Tax=Ostreobium quekettii TaxID=121088 RepID=A0A8S1IX82_9CHLO|nr:unnamed protein product [Ostreobium quekettii]
MLGQEERDSVRAEVEKKKKENLVEAAPQDPTASDVPPPTAGEPKDESMTQGADVKEDEKDAKADGDAAPEAASLAKKDKDGSVPEPEDMSHDGAVAEEPGHGTDPMNVEEPESRKEGTGVPEAGDMDVEMEPAPPGADAATKVEVTDDDVLAAWLESLEQVYEGSKRELARRKPFEDCIKRPYFHVKPLDSTQLTNWNKYLDYIEKNGDHVAAVTLYERCLIACACYPEFWKRYVRYLEANDLKLARGALQRATLVYCKRKADMHLFSAHFEERHGNIDEARKVFKHVQTLIAPRLLSMIVQFANFERRQGNTDTACTILTENIEEEKSKEGSKIYNFLCLHSAHFLNMVVKDKLRARAVLDAALAHRPGAKALWQGAIQLEEGICDDDSVSRTLDLYDRCTSPPEDGAEALSEKDREELSLQCVEFADLRCDANVRAAIERRHTERFPFPVASGDTKKRSASEQGSVPASKVHRTGMEGSAYGAGQLAMTSAVTPGTVGAMVPSPAAAQPHMYYGQQMATGQMTTNQQYNQYAQYYSQYQGYNYTGYGY